MGIDTDQYGQVVDPHHDGSLLGICVVHEDCELRYQSTDGVFRLVRLRKVHAMDVSSFREGNTILSMSVIPKEDALALVSKDALKRLGWGSIPKLRGRIIFVLESSYGADVIADCEDAELTTAS